jgi:hypothetical protein
MNLRFFHRDDPAHRDASELLPWLVNDSLAGAERDSVERHVRECVTCRRELEAVRTLQAAVASEERDPAVVSALARLRVRLDEEEAGLPRRLRHALARGWRAAQPWVRGTLAAQFALILLLCGVLTGALLSERSTPALYRTLSDAAGPVPPNRSGLVVVFRADTTEQEMRRLLQRLDARVVDGPSSMGAYTLAVREGRYPAVLALLRTDPAVMLAEPAPAQGRDSR